MTKEEIDVPKVVRSHVFHVVHGDTEIANIPEKYRDIVIQIVAGIVKMKPEVSK